MVRVSGFRFRVEGLNVGVYAVRTFALCVGRCLGQLVARAVFASPGLPPQVQALAPLQQATLLRERRHSQANTYTYINDARYVPRPYVAIEQ